MIKDVSKREEGLSTVNEVSEARLWKTLDSISERLGGIDKRLSELVRLEERVNNHEQALSRYGNRLDNHDKRLHESEIWQASYGDKSSLERTISSIKKEIHDINLKVDDLENKGHVSRGQKDVVKEILKWVTGLLAGILVYMITRGTGG
jgi:chromosome segregation ATPase